LRLELPRQLRVEPRLLEAVRSRLRRLPDARANTQGQLLLVPRPDREPEAGGRMTSVLHRRVERSIRRREVGAANELQRLGSTPLAVHAAVLPLDRERTCVADLVECPEELVEVDVAVTGGDEVPAAFAASEVEVRAQDRAAPVEAALRVLHVDVKDPVR